jgi:hypothetical protein
MIYGQKTEGTERSEEYNSVWHSCTEELRGMLVVSLKAELFLSSTLGHTPPTDSER